MCITFWETQATANLQADDWTPSLDSSKKIASIIACRFISSFQVFWLAHQLQLQMFHHCIKSTILFLPFHNRLYLLKRFKIFCSLQMEYTLDQSSQDKQVSMQEIIKSLPIACRTVGITTCLHSSSICNRVCRSLLLRFMQSASYFCSCLRSSAIICCKSTLG